MSVVGYFIPQLLFWNIYFIYCFDVHFFHCFMSNLVAEIIMDFMVFFVLITNLIISIYFAENRIRENLLLLVPIICRQTNICLMVGVQHH